MAKIFIGPKLRQLRKSAGQTQSYLANELKVSPAYINLIENNQRSISVAVLLALSDIYKIDAKELTSSNEFEALNEIRAIVKDPIFAGQQPDLQEIRAAIENAPNLISQFVDLYNAYQKLAEHTQKTGNTITDVETLGNSQESSIYSFLQKHSNHFSTLEDKAQEIRSIIGGPQDDIYALLKRHLRTKHSILSEVQRLSIMSGTLREFDEQNKRIYLSEALNQANRNFQLAFVIAKLEAEKEVNDIINKIQNPNLENLDQLRAELYNYVAASILMPLSEFSVLAKRTNYDIDRIAAGLGVTFEQVCHRLTTIHGADNSFVPFFLIRQDRAGNVTKRVSGVSNKISDQGGGCPVWNIHSAFQTPDIIIPQFIELWDEKQYFSIARTVERPVFSRRTQDRRLLLILGCEAKYAEQLGYAKSFNLDEKTLYTKIGTNCHTCPRQGCLQRAHQPIHVKLKFDQFKRGATRYES